MNISRKQFLRSSAIAAAIAPIKFSNLMANPFLETIKQNPRGFLSTAIDQKLSISIFSKHLHWLDHAEMAKLAKELGYDGIDLTVRKDGHVSPEKVSTDLPKVVELIRATGLEVYTITTDIRTSEEPHTKNILKTAAALGIKNYRMGWYAYTGNDVETDLAVFNQQLKGLSVLNEHYQIHGDYENHTGRFGGAIWDLWLTLKDLNPQWTGCQFDIRHATVDGAEAWSKNLELVRRYLGSITIKDFQWEKKGNKWSVQNVPLGQGMVDFNQYFRILKEYGFKKPISQHFEYPLGGAESGARVLSIPKEEVIAHMRQDLQTLKKWLTA